MGRIVVDGQLKLGVGGGFQLATDMKPRAPETGP